MKTDGKIIKGVGIDMVDISRFKKFKKTSVFLKRVFSKKELNYCFSFKDAASRLAGCFAAKEAAVKAYGGKATVFDIEVRHDPLGKPELWKKGKKIQDVMLSVTHAEKIACALIVLI